MECVVDGRTLTYERRGAGTPIVLLNGFAATRFDRDPTFLAALSLETVQEQERALADWGFMADHPVSLAALIGSFLAANTP